VNTEETGESPLMIPLIERMRAYNLRIDEIKADKGYGSDANRTYVESIGATFYCPFKRNQGLHSTEPWDSQLRAFRPMTDRWDRGYHERSVIESTFSADKRVNRKWILSRNFVAQQSEILARYVVRNLRVLIQQYFERGIVIDFLDRFTLRRLEELRRAFMPADESA
jgi:transposase